MKRILISIAVVVGLLAIVPIAPTVLGSAGSIVGMKPGDDMEARAIVAKPPLTVPDWNACLTMPPNEPGDAAHDYARAESDARALLRNPNDHRLSAMRQQLTGLKPFMSGRSQTLQGYEHALKDMTAAQSALTGSQKSSCSNTWVDAIDMRSKTIDNARTVTRGLCYLGDYYVYTNPQQALAYYEAAIVYAGRNMNAALKGDKPFVVKLVTASVMRMALEHLEAFHRHTQNTGGAAKARTAAQETENLINALQTTASALCKSRDGAVLTQEKWEDIAPEIFHPDAVANAIFLATGAPEVWLRWEACSVLGIVKDTYPAARRALLRVAENESHEPLRSYAKSMVK